MVPVETHPLPAFAPLNAKLLMLGSFPPPRARWKMDFYYPNFQNDMWRIFGLVFFNDKNYFVQENGKAFKETLLREFLTRKGIAISDSAYQVRRLQNNASDKFLEIVTPIDLQALLEKLPLCDTIMTTGRLATDTLLSLMPQGVAKPSIGEFIEITFYNRYLRLYRLLSSSRAYPLALAKKAAVYKQFFTDIGLM